MKFAKVRIPARWAWTIGIAVTLVLAAMFHRSWWPQTQAWVQTAIAGQRVKSTLDEHDHGAGGHDHSGHDHSGHDHGGHDHGGHDHGHDDGSSLELSTQALGNIGLTAEHLQPVQLETFRRTITVPGIVVDRPGRTRLEVSTPMAGVITHVHAVQGEAVNPGTLLFEIRITAKELVATQTELLKTVGDLDVENREIKRLTDVTASGAVSQKTLLERQYAKDKLEVLYAAQREALRLQGLSEQQVDEIAKNRRLLRNLQISAPSPDEHSHEELRLTKNPVVPVGYEENPPAATPPPLILQEVRVHKGETVAAGTTLAIIADHSELYIEGRAFEQDVDLLSHSVREGWPVSAMFEGGGQRTETVPGLELLYSASTVDVESRTLRFYARLPNRVVRDVASPNGLHFVEWKYRPGQRLQVQVPVEEWKDKIVLPVDAITQEGAEFYVFQQNGKHFDRVAVHVAYRDQLQVVIASDGSIFPGDVIARRGAHQMQMALKNKSGGGVDPHAGHNH